jgi:hypothetical protein
MKASRDGDHLVDTEAPALCGPQQWLLGRKNDGLRILAADDPEISPGTPATRRYRPAAAPHAT